MHFLGAWAIRTSSFSLSLWKVPDIFCSIIAHRKRLKLLTNELTEPLYLFSGQSRVKPMLVHGGPHWNFAQCPTCPAELRCSQWCPTFEPAAAPSWKGSTEKTELWLWSLASCDCVTGASLLAPVSPPAKEVNAAPRGALRTPCKTRAVKWLFGEEEKKHLQKLRCGEKISSSQVHRVSEH